MLLQTGTAMHQQQAARKLPMCYRCCYCDIMLSSRLQALQKAVLL